MQQGSVGRAFQSALFRQRLHRWRKDANALNTRERVATCRSVRRLGYHHRVLRHERSHRPMMLSAAQRCWSSSLSSTEEEEEEGGGKDGNHHYYVISERSSGRDGAFHSSSSSSLIKATRTNVDSKQFLQERGRGAYTTARTVGQTKVFDLEAHLNRTADNLIAITGTDVSREEIIIETKHVMANAIQAFLQEGERGDERQHSLRKGGVSREIRLTVHATASSLSSSSSPPPPPPLQEEKDDDDREDAGASPLIPFRVSCHASFLPEMPRNPVMIEVRGVARRNAKVKDSEWISQRSEIEKLVSPDANEFVLLDARNGIIEGSQSNFYALIGGRLYTAGEGILEGTIRRVVLDVCRREKIPVVLQSPSVSSLLREEWQGCAISSTSRLLLPVGKVVVPRPLHMADETKDPVVKFNYPSDCLMSFLESKVEDEIDYRSTEINK
mmetsp:Transcript_34468/g.48115  ORF Transcript_34468/g.48115 Transcript_34468/m.48115 type:complete len:442 (+) Transcript_34468:242-1567(+)